jgi:hypothetical protein
MYSMLAMDAFAVSVRSMRPSRGRMSPDLHLPLDHLISPGCAPGTPDPWLLVLMHGVGSNEQDLFGLAPADSRPLSCAEPARAARMGPGFACVV